MVFHVSTAEGAAVIRQARGRGLKVFAETCPQYLFMTKDDLDRPGVEGAKWMCSPPTREVADQTALWQALALGDLQTVTSDHAALPPRRDRKARGRPQSDLQADRERDARARDAPAAALRCTRVPRPARIRGEGLESFVRLTATAPAAIYNLPGKGALLPGYDADIAIWDPERTVTISDDLMHDRTGFTPFAGTVVRGWPERVLRRGEEIIADGACKAIPGSGRWLGRQGGWAAEPTGRLVADMDPRRNFGAELL